ncbi:Proton-dependent oligopeptide transporter [Trema orientale]|uniref:Proton-dependent oligopeptide transporter n=1 Tax=Trema orientale TaxID=63057 RepID=A0A2P5EXV2_TREOI|nr:Proton-dependent oligopeptide transporter [Trema orientale]
MELDNKNMTAADDETVEKNMTREKKLGGKRTMPFIFANEICDRFGNTGFQANMITYLTQELNLPVVKASNILTNFVGTTNLTPIIGALIADSFAGRFWTITIGAIIYEMGLLSVTISALFPSLRPPPCPTQTNCVEASGALWILYLSLLLTSIGSGGIRPNVVTFAADQLDMTKSAVAKRRWNFFNIYYFCMGLATLTALTVVVYIQDNVGWGWGLGIPTISMAISIIVFLVGSPLYKKLKPGGSPLVRLAQVVVAAVKKRNAVVPADHNLLYENKGVDAGICLHEKLLHSNQYKFLDRAAVVTPHEEPRDSTTPPNLWTLSTVHRVEELKCIIRMLPIWAATILLVTAESHQHSFFILQARTMNRHLGGSSFQIPPASLPIFGTLTILTGLVLYDRFLVPFARRRTKHPAGLTPLQRLGIGYGVNIFSTTVCALVEMKRKSVAARHNLLDSPKAVIPISVFWLVPQYSLHGLAEVFMTVGRLEFLYDQSPESMRSTAVALNWLALSIGNYVGTLLVSLVHKYSGSGDKNWLPDRNLNRGKLEYYYLLISGIQVANFVYFAVCARFYSYKPMEEISKVICKEGDVELLANNDGTSGTTAYDKDDEEVGKLVCKIETV